MTNKVPWVLLLLIFEVITSLRDTSPEALGLTSPGVIRNAREPDVDIEKEQRTMNELISKLNQEQKVAVGTVIKALSVTNPAIVVPGELEDFVDHALLPSRFFFLDGPGGAGKTFVYHTVISIMKSSGC